MREDLKQTVLKHKEGTPVPPVITSDYSAFDALFEITGTPYGTRHDLFEEGVPGLRAFRPTVKVAGKAVAEGTKSKEAKGKSPTYSVDEIREIVRLSHLSSENGSQCLVIFDADTMTPEAANAFLKTLEDVPKGAFFILTASNRSRMLETVLSRCVFIDSNEEALTPTPEMAAAVSKFISGSAAELLYFTSGKMERAECLTILRLLSDWIRKGVFSANACRRIQESYCVLSTTNVTPYYELDKALFAVAAEMKK